MKTINVQACIVGGGPAGMMAGLLLARAGVRVAVLEKHKDFLRDFRGDTIHPSTLEVMEELGLGEKFLALPHSKVERISGVIDGKSFGIADLRHLPTKHRYIAIMPQWDFLDFLAQAGKRYPGFGLMMRTEATDLIEADGRVTGVRATSPEGEIAITSDLVIAADGRHSLMRERSGFERETFGAPMDVLWFRLPRREDGDGEAVAGRFGRGHMMVTIDRGDYWQCAYIVPKGGDAAIRAKGLAAFRASVVEIAPFLSDRADQIASLDDVKLLTVVVDRLTRWHRPGLLCIGDAAHAMSPIGGVGVNIAVQDAVAAANILAAPLREGRVAQADLERLQARRLPAAKRTQAVQRFMQDRFIARVLDESAGPLKAPLAMRIVDRLPLLQRIPARVLGMGFQPEHVEVPAAS